VVTSLLLAASLHASTIRGGVSQVWRPMPHGSSMWGGIRPKAATSAATVWVDSYASAMTASSVKTLAYTLNNVAGDLLVVGVEYKPAATSTVWQVLYGTATCSIASSVVGATRNNDMWYLAHPPTGSNTVTVNLTSNGMIGSGAITFRNGATVSGFASTFGTIQAVTLTVTGIAGGMVVDSFVGGKTSDPAVCGQTQVYYGTFGSGANKTVYAGSVKAGAASVNMVWTQNASEEYAESAFAVNP